VPARSLARQPARGPATINISAIVVAREVAVYTSPPPARGQDDFDWCWADASDFPREMGRRRNAPAADSVNSGVAAGVMLWRRRRRRHVPYSRHSVIGL